MLLKWFIFNKCNSFISLPNISKWKTSNVTDMEEMFNELHSLISIPDIAKWDNSKIKNNDGIFKNCILLISLPNKSKKPDGSCNIKVSRI